ncbi:hypothetical protein VB773_19960 [Haloarculaceae archaeon H-GB2-1]|nr:hypothetical protein [Haloarculaceae archaeon H-GB2-1]
MSDFTNKNAAKEDFTVTEPLQGGVNDDISQGFMTQPFSSDDVSSPPSVEGILQTTTPNVVMRDPQLQKRGIHARAQLRSIPFFDELGINTVVHGDVYDNNFKLVDYTHHSATDIVETVEDVEFPLVHITTQEGIKEYGEEELVRALLQRATEEREWYILVTDTTSPRLPTYIQKPGRGIVDDYDVAVKDYKTLSARYLEDYVNSGLPASQTRNLHYHRASEFHKQHGAPADTLENIYDYTRAPSGSPVWEPLYYFIEHDLENVLDEYSERISDALRSWTERGDTRNVANQMLDALRVCEFQKEQLQEYQQTDPQLR